MGKGMVRKLVSFPEELWEKVNDFRFSKRLPSENEAVRQLVQRGLEEDVSKTADASASR